MMNNKKLLTIVIPQHSEDENTIIHLLTSISHQIGINMLELDIKIIGDGGYKLADDFLSAFNKMNIDYVYYNESKGPGYARQFGTELADSSYISYLDADDQLNTINSLWKFIDVIRRTGDHEVIFSKYIEEFPPNNEGMNSFKLREFNPAAAYGKWISLEYIRKHKFIWHPLLTHAYEDTFFLDMVISFSNDIYYLDSPTYSWLHNPNSIVREGPDYNQLHLNEYVLENRLWAIEIKKRSPDRYKFDVNNGLGVVYNFIINHPPINEIKDKVYNELNQYIYENRAVIDVKYAKKLFQQNHSDISSDKFQLFIKNELKKTGAFSNTAVDNNYTKLLSIVVPFNSNNIDELYPLLSSINYQIGIDLFNIEIIIIKDGGDKITDDLKSLFPNLNIRLMLFDRKMGPGPIRSIGIKNAFGKYIMFCDSDDQLHVDNGLLIMKMELDKVPDAQIIMGKYVNEQLDENGNVSFVVWDYNFGAVYPHWFNVAFLRAHLIDFNPNLHSYYEDTFFVGIASRVANKISFVETPIYTHKFNSNSMIHHLDSDVIHEKFIIERCTENYYWFKETRLRFPNELLNDINNFIVSLYYMYESYNISSTKLDKTIATITHKIVDDNKKHWNGWNQDIQTIADKRNDGDAKGIDSNGLKQFMERFFT